MHKRDSILTPPAFSIDPLDPKNDAAYYDYLDALDWEKANMESNRGRIYEQEAGRGPRRDITSRNAPGYHDFDGKEYMHVPKRLNSGRNFWGFTGSRAGLSPMTKRISKAHTPKHFWEQMKNFWPNKINSYIVSEKKKDADFWADKAGFMEGRNARGGMVYEEVPASLRQPGMRRSLFGDSIIAQRTHDDYTDNKIPRGLVQGRTFWGLPGGRSSRGVGTAKRMIKSISSMNQGGVKHVVGGYRGGKMSKAMDMKTHTPRLPSTKRDIPDSDKYFR